MCVCLCTQCLLFACSSKPVKSTGNIFGSDADDGLLLCFRFMLSHSYTCVRVYHVVVAITEKKPKLPMVKVTDVALSANSNDEATPTETGTEGNRDGGLNKTQSSG